MGALVALLAYSAGDGARIEFVLVGLAPRGLDVCRFAGTQVNTVYWFSCGVC